jgi:hypothetical protein
LFKRYQFDQVEGTMQVYINYFSLEMDSLHQVGKAALKVATEFPDKRIFTLYENVKDLKTDLADYPKFVPD